MGRNVGNTPRGEPRRIQRGKRLGVWHAGFDAYVNGPEVDAYRRLPIEHGEIWPKLGRTALPKDAAAIQLLLSNTNGKYAGIFDHLSIKIAVPRTLRKVAATIGIEDTEKRLGEFVRGNAGEIPYIPSNIREITGRNAQKLVVAYPSDETQAALDNEHHAFNTAFGKSLPAWHDRKLVLGVYKSSDVESALAGFNAHVREADGVLLTLGGVTLSSALPE